MCSEFPSNKAFGPSGFECESCLCDLPCLKNTVFYGGQQAERLKKKIPERLKVCEINLFITERNENCDI